MGAGAGTSSLGELRQLIAGAGRELRSSRRLRRSLVGWVLIGWVLMEGFSLEIAVLHGGGILPIALGGLAWWLAVALVFAAGVPLLMTPEGVRLDHFGIPNGLSALRAWACYPLLLCATLNLPHSLGLILWCTVGWVAGMLDFVDGLIARRIGPITALGKAIDPAMDALFFMMAAIGNVFLGIVPPWLAALILVRFAGPLLATPIVFAMRRRPELSHTVWGRRNTGATGYVFFILMWVRIFNGPVNAVALVLALPTLLPTTLLHFHQLWLRARQAPLARLATR